jgi:hypothetical protein
LVGNSLKQLAGYTDTADEKDGWLAVFDRGSDKSWDENILEYKAD